MDNNKQCDGCQVAANVPYAAFEAVSARAERNIRRLALIIVFLILALIGSNIAWLCYESQFEDVTSQTEQTVTQDTAGGGDNNFVGGDMVARQTIRTKTVTRRRVRKTAAIGYNDIVGRTATRSAVFLPGRAFALRQPGSG